MISGDLARVLAVSDWKSVQSVLICGTVIIAATVLFYAAVRIWLRRAHASNAADFAIDDIEQLHRKGLISDEEFSRLRRKALGVAEPKQAPPAKPPEKSV